MKTFTLAALALTSLTAVASAHAGLTFTLTDNITGATADLGLGTIDVSALRLRKRPDILYAEWDSLTADAIVNNPLYQGGGSSGTNPLYDSPTFKVTVGAGGMSHLHKEGIIHRDLAARVFFSVPSSPTPFLQADIIFTIEDTDLLGSTTNPDWPDLLGQWATKAQVGLANVGNVARGTPPLYITNASWAFTAVPAPAAATLLAAAGLAATRRRRA